MKDISYHILDIARNSLNAGANLIEISITEHNDTGELILQIRDNGYGMTEDMLKRITDPFFTTSSTKKVGLGLPLLKQNAELTGGCLRIESERNRGTLVTALFHQFHIDMIPEGDLAMTFRSLISSNPESDFLYRHRADEGEFILDTAEIRRELEGISLNAREVLDYITDYIRENLKALKIKEM